MKLHDLKPAPGSTPPRTRVGRGIAAGQGKTAGRGTKGQHARAGASIPAWFEGGQTPIHIRVPKLRGFKNPFRDRVRRWSTSARSRRMPRPAVSASRPSSPRPGQGSAPSTTREAAKILRGDAGRSVRQGDQRVRRQGRSASGERQIGRPVASSLRRARVQSAAPADEAEALRGRAGGRALAEPEPAAEPATAEAPAAKRRSDCRSVQPTADGGRRPPKPPPTAAKSDENA